MATRAVHLHTGGRALGLLYRVQQKGTSYRSLPYREIEIPSPVLRVLTVATLPSAFGRSRGSLRSRVADGNQKRRSLRSPSASGRCRFPWRATPARQNRRQ